MSGTCPVCGHPVENLIRVGAYLFTEPCAHRIVDLGQFAWYGRYERVERKRQRHPETPGHMTNT